ncbi:MAG TPA: argininosuccinate lyase [Flavipsychrobacter sp.]|nr:argininosuccinate lyase [Flavipsychrobacter sp.]
MKIWQKNNTDISEQVERFTVGNDRDFDLLLARYDVKGSLAHTAMLCEVGLLTREEYEVIHNELENIHAEIEAGHFNITPECEDIHSQVEWMLTQRIGEAGKKIHSGRSRNDQVAVAIKLYLKDELKIVKTKVLDLFDLLIALSNKHSGTLMPGYTHLQVAMPSSFGLWFGAYAEALVDDMDMLLTAFRMTDKNPLGSGAGYGSSFPLNREMTTRLLGFRDMHYNSIYAQMSRGKTEKFVSFGLSAVAATLSKLSTDVCLYNSQNFGFISLPDNLTTGSSIMPHKKNPDVFELIRAKCNRIQSTPNELTLLINNLPSGYHRDMQLTKEILFPAIESLKSCLDLALLMFQHIEVKQDILNDAKYEYIFTVEKLNDMVSTGIPFRDAYRQVGEEVAAGSFMYQAANLSHTHEGSIGNLCNDKVAKNMDFYRKEH